MSVIGLGDINARIKVYIQNIPPLEQYLQLAHCRPITDGEISAIAQQTGNHWRKIFNVYAKLIYQLHQPKFNTWQEYRDQQLLQQNSSVSLLFSPPENECQTMSRENSTIELIMGKTYAAQLGIAQSCHWLSNDFAINENQKRIICPYFDYRQLSNIKITQLCQLIRLLEKK